MVNWLVSRTITPVNTSIATMTAKPKVRAICKVDGTGPIVPIHPMHPTNTRVAVPITSPKAAKNESHNVASTFTSFFSPEKHMRILPCLIYLDV